MGTIREDVEIIGTVKGKKVKALFDTGAYRNYIKKVFYDNEKAEDIGFHIFEGLKKIILADGSITHGEMVVFREIRINGYSLKEVEFVIMNDLTEDAIIGVHLMQKLGINLEPQNKRIVIRR